MQTENFLSLLDKDWSKLKKHARLISFRKGQVLFYEGHYPYGLYFLIQGKIKFIHQGKNCSEDHYTDFKNTQILCLKSFLKNLSYHCHAYLLTDAEFLFLSKIEILNQD